MRRYPLSVIAVLAILLGAALSGCLVQTNNSVNGDAQLFAPAQGNQAFAQVSSILKQNCVPCHASNIASYSEAQLISNGYVVPKLPYQSLLYERLKGSNAGGSTPEDMPQNQPGLSASDLQTIRNWIEGLSEAAPSPSPTPTTLFGKADLVLTNNCFSCHTSWKNDSQQDFITKGLIVPGDSDSSPIYYNLQGTNVTGKPTGLMPKGGNPLAAPDIQTIREWIDSLPPEPAPSTSPSVGPEPTPSPAPTIPSASPEPSLTPSPSPTPSAGLLPASGRTAAAMSVIANQCSFCHADPQTATSTLYGGKSVPVFAAFTLDSQFVSSGLVVAGNPAGSWLYQSLQTYGTLNLMPEDSSPLDSVDAETLQVWIQNIGNP